MPRMNKLPSATREQILSMLCEGSSMNSIARVSDVSPNTVAKLLMEAGKACEAFHDKEVRNVRSKRAQCDEIWSFVHAKQKNVAQFPLRRTMSLSSVASTLIFRCPARY